MDNGRNALLLAQLLTMTTWMGRLGQRFWSGLQSRQTNHPPYWISRNARCQHRTHRFRLCSGSQHPEDTSSRDSLGFDPVQIGREQERHSPRIFGLVRLRLYGRKPPVSMLDRTIFNSHALETNCILLGNPSGTDQG